MTPILMNLLQYIAIAVVVSLTIAAWDNGKWWDTRRYLFIGAIWPLSGILILLLISYKYIRKKIINK